MPRVSEEEDRNTKGQFIQKHGHTSSKGGRIVLSPTYYSWSRMKERCLSSKHPAYHRYGGRGISICSEWLTFDGFLADMGERPEGRCLERRNNDGNYSPKNCYWATPAEQNRNKSTNHYIVIKDIVMTLSDWAHYGKASVPRVSQRIAAGWEPEQAIFTPVDQRFDNRRKSKSA